MKLTKIGIEVYTMEKRIPRNMILWLTAENDPARYRTRTVKPKKGKGRKKRPRDKRFDSFECAA